MIVNNPVIVAKYFQYRVKISFKVFVIDGPLGKSKYYAIWVKLQIRGSPHINFFIWFINAPNFLQKI